MEKLEMIDQSCAELYTKILSTPNYKDQDKLRFLIQQKAKEMSHSTNFKRDHSDEDWLEGIRIKGMCDLLFFKGTISAKQVAWMVRYAIKHNVQL